MYILGVLKQTIVSLSLLRYTAHHPCLMVTLVLELEFFYTPSEIFILHTLHDVSITTSDRLPTFPKKYKVLVLLQSTAKIQIEWNRACHVIFLFLLHIAFKLNLFLIQKYASKLQYIKCFTLRSMCLKKKIYPIITGNLIVLTTY